MYKVIIKTLYNTINLEVEDINSPEVQEIFNQPYIVEIRAEQIKESDGKARKLVKKEE